ncbi:hypothetical protein CEUSTIGMA_g13452.t1 [Chlamydomonas eustigma]|uniref:Uncharacterized protein n=1 Tax=Chlamydomonas eustigma TaxID=1157962 RepID=A0A250XSI7_9CHLO|nr:hypothetical protein CEUSTIGMA_g13452.t1 [Chlamydomonas eustigma]|eukprot:GAX86037.1 hypothetical protein CEUSTIGMA_g13452.t1 [Chlamydomonas eustigma]
MSDFHKLTLRDNDIEDEDAEGCAALLALQSSALEVDKQSSPRKGKRSRNNSFIKDGPRRGRPPSLQFDQLDVFDASCEDYMLQKDPQRPMLTQDLFSLGCSDLTFAMKRQRSTTRSNLSLSLGHGSGTVNMQGVHIQGASSETGAGNLLGLQRSGGLVMPVLYLKDGTALYAPSAGSVEGPTALLTAAGGMQSQQQHVVLTAGQAMQLLGAAGAAPGSVQWAGGLGLQSFS